MKKIILIASLPFIPLCFNAQSFHKGAVVADLNSGIEFYNTTLNYRTNRNGFSGDTTIQDQAGNANVALGVEIGLGKHFGLGIRGKANSFFADVDALTSKNTAITSTDLMIMIAVHPIVRKRFDLVLGSDLGVSGFNFKIDDLNNTVVSGNGSYVTVYLNPRLYFRRFGFNLKTYVPFVNYNDLESNGTNIDKFIVQKWKGNGFGVTVGVQVRLF
jgi:hypothetical protein